jgi:F-type H+-transporting ATPase subunit gamma
VAEEVAVELGEHAAGLLGAVDDPKKILLLALVADRGLCGGYNANVLRTVDRTVKAGQPSGIEYKIVTSGRRRRRTSGTAVCTSSSRSPVCPTGPRSKTPERSRWKSGPRSWTNPSIRCSSSPPDSSLRDPGRGDPPASAPPDRRERSRGDDSRKDDLPEAGADATGGLPATSAGGYTEFEPDGVEILEELVARHVEAAVFQAMLEAAASEHTARQRAMAAATENADELTKTLTRVMNRARQDAITTEIMEIVGGAEALRQGPEEE